MPRLLHGFGVAWGAQERGADGGDHGARADRGTASVVAAFCRSRSVVGRRCVDQSTSDGVAADDTRRADRGLDHRRSGPTETRAAPGWGVKPVLGARW